ncbi:MAG: aminotransferase class I/II-fold pyridoxal phosphate-dependent enzyme [Proteobacteria bacterium]|nr:aminotransferase class I/II-fold pyridoxal phosphate-dependent enzyme [Pseudomonadota bacterium]
MKNQNKARHSTNIETLAIHGPNHNKNPHGSLASPIYQTSTFVFDSVEQGSARFTGDQPGYIYGRLDNPTTHELEERMAALEQTEAAAAFGSGMGAISATLLTFLKNGDELVSTAALYGCTYSLLKHHLPAMGINVKLVEHINEGDVEDHLEQAVTEKTRVMYLETPSNPGLQVLDLSRLIDFCKARNIITVIDNTFMSPVLQNPAVLGADLVVHSATKYLNGHGDVIAGIACGSEERIAEIKATMRKDLGAIISPNDAWLLMRGLKTLPLRVEKHVSNAVKVAAWLEQHPHIVKVNYPGLPSHPGYRLIGSQMQAGGAVMAFELDGEFEQAVALMNHVSLCKLAVSLGDVETLIQHPASMTHSTYTPEELADAGISATMVRLAVGLEHADDIIADLEQAINRALQTPRGLAKAS